MINISSPRNSFITFSGPTYKYPNDGCFDTEGLCLPFSALSDINFQVLIKKVIDDPGINDFRFYFCRNCDTAQKVGDGSGSIWRSSVDGTKYYGIPYGWEDDPADFFSPGDCFSICLEGPDFYIYTWDINNLATIQASGGHHWRMNMGAFHANFTVSDSHGIDMAYLVGFMNGAFASYGIWSAVGTILMLKADDDVVAASLTLDDIDNAQSHPYPITEGYDNTLVAKGCSNCFIYTGDDTCFSTKISYRNDNNSMGFEYNNNDSAPLFINTVRLPFFLKNGEPISTKNVFRLSDGNYRKTLEIMELQFEGEVEWINLDWHTKLAIALAHQWLWIFDDDDGSSMLYVMDADSKYEIDSSTNKRGTNFALAPASFVVKQMPFENFTNSCCNESQ